jgi:1-acyl-sn-glycerol-3-phosphate acyltransferase
MGFLRYLILLGIQRFSQAYFQTFVRSINLRRDDDWKDIKLVLVLNHTSLYEFLYSAFIPKPFLKRFAYHGMFPVADQTLNKPIMGRIFKFLAPKVISLTRKRDASWSSFLDQWDRDGVIIFFPEGRMKRQDGLDKFGKAMTVRGGVYDLLQRVGSGDILLVYPAGLHHINTPGNLTVSLHKDLHITLEKTQIGALIDPQSNLDESNLKKNLITELERRRQIYAHSFEADADTWIF